MMKKLTVCFLLAILFTLTGCSKNDGAAVTDKAISSTKLFVVKRPNANVRNDFYVGNRAPLLPSAFMKLPIGSIKPGGWVRRQLQLQANGFIGHLTEISAFLKKKDNAWLSPKGEGHSPWEEAPYWLKGFGDTGYVLGDERIIEETRLWIESAIASQREDGYFGPRANLHEPDGSPDIWPNMIMLFALQSYYEYSGDKRVLELMTKYFRWELTVPDEKFTSGSWQHVRAGDNLVSVYWLYNRTGEKWLLDLAEKTHRNTADWTSSIRSWHNVNFCQCFRSPAMYYMQSKDPKHYQATERNLKTMMDIYGQVPGGLFGSDENCREGFIGPRQAVETCGVVEMMLSTELLFAFTGDVKWADLCEEVAFNIFPASMTPDLKALRYLTSPNMVLSDKENKNPGLQNGGPMLLMNPHYHRCCQHNVGHGWPYYAEHLWLATPGNGLAAVLYAQCEVTAKVGDGTEVTITEKTHYPFDEKIEFTVSSPRPVQFPLYLRVPGWCENPQLKINGKVAELRARPRSYIVIERRWTDGDKISLELPMRITLTTWRMNKNSVSVSRGPLTYSLKIGEKYVREGGTDKWPAWEIYPTTPWNYGFVLDDRNPEASFTVVRKEWPDSDQPFEANAAPIGLRAKASKIKNWKMDHLGLVGSIQESPVKSDGPIESVTLIPMGCARLRISAFPVIGRGPNAHEWIETISVTASHSNESDTVEAIIDRLLPKNSNDQDIPRFTWWDHKGSREWVIYNLGKAIKVSAVEIYWYDDELSDGGCRVPKSWRMMYKDGEEWKPVTNAGAYHVEKDKFNKITFDPVTTEAMGLEVELQPGFSGGILEMRVK